MRRMAEVREFEFRPAKDHPHRSKSPGVIGRLSSFARGKHRHSMNEKASKETSDGRPRKVGDWIRTRTAFGEGL